MIKVTKVWSWSCNCGKSGKGSGLRSTERAAFDHKRKRGGPKCARLQVSGPPKESR